MVRRELDRLDLVAVLKMKIRDIAMASHAIAEEPTRLHRGRRASSLVIVSPSAMWPKAIEVDVAHGRRGPMQVTVDEDGETRVRDRFVVSAPVAGRLQRIELEPGDTVVARQDGGGAAAPGRAAAARSAHARAS